jgi:hypothetical protein
MSELRKQHGIMRSRAKRLYHPQLAATMRTHLRPPE